MCVCVGGVEWGVCGGGDKYAMLEWVNVEIGPLQLSHHVTYFS